MITMEKTIVRKSGLKEIPLLIALGRETFIEAFAAGNTEENLNAYLESHFNEGKLREELSNPDSLFFIAWDGSHPIGYLKVNSGSAQTELKSSDSLEIERIYVKNAYQGKRVGQLLYEKAIAEAISQKRSYVWLGVWEENKKAIGFYEKNGFVAFDKHIFRMGEDEQTDIMMKKNL